MSLRQPEVEHLHRAVGSQLDVRWLQIAVDDPLLVRRFERLRRSASRSAAPRRVGVAPLCDAVRERRPSTSSITSAVDALASLEAVDARRCSDGSATRACALRARSGARRSRSRAKASGRTLIATSRSSLRVGARDRPRPSRRAPRAERISYGPRRVPGERAIGC